MARPSPTADLAPTVPKPDGTASTGLGNPLPDSRVRLDSPMPGTVRPDHGEPEVGRFLAVGQLQIEDEVILPIRGDRDRSRLGDPGQACPIDVDAVDVVRGVRVR